MAHKEQREFCMSVKERFPDYFKNKNVLDIGSLDINGSNRELFEDCNYLGLDVGEGKNVDLVCVGHLFEGPDNYFDTIISTEVFEHDMYYEETIKNIMRMLKPGGLFLFTCAAPGRPEHGTRRYGEFCAPLLMQISEEWADYYKNLEETDIRKISSFNEMFPDCYFEFKNTDIEIPADLYFYGIKGGKKYLTNRIKPLYDEETFKDHIFVIDCWPNNESKENDLVNLIKRLKLYNIQILLTGHYPIKPEIQKMVDYYIFDKNNPLLLSSEFAKYDVHSGRWTDFDNYFVSNEMEFHHDYAIWETMRNAFNFCNYLNKKYIHFLEYDNLPDLIQYRQCFLEQIPNFDAVIYEYRAGSSVDTGHNPFCATFIFSLKTEIALNMVSQINNKFEYFCNKPKGWQLERVFLENLRKVTSNILNTSYIDNDGTLNTQAVWNRDGVSRNGAIFQIYPVTDSNSNLYIHLISGFHEIPADRDYKIEINYRGYKKFITLYKGHILVEKVGKYRKGERVKMYYQGVEIFNEFLNLDSHEFQKINSVKIKNPIPQEPPKIKLNFVDGPYLELTDEDDRDREYNVKFIDKKTGEVKYDSKIKSGWFASSSIKYFVDWRVEIKSDNFYTNYDFNLKNQRVLICFESKSLGDSLAWIQYVEKFRQVHDCKIICSTFHNDLFGPQYPEIEFINPGGFVNDLYALYRLGVFYETNVNYDTFKHPMNPFKVPLLKIATDILGLDFEELKPKLPNLGKKKNKRVCIAIHSTAQCKYWNNPNGWQDVVDFLIEKGYEVRLLSKEEDGYMGNKTPKGVKRQPIDEISIIDTIKTLQESELFIGISSGLSWLSWASGTPTILISGFTDDYMEPENGITRIINKEVCHGCWHDHTFDPGDWNWCPINKNTNKQFECSKSIESLDVINKIKSILF